MEATDNHRRKYFLGANWKCNGNTAFVKDIITHLINTFDFDPNRLGMSTVILHMSANK